MLRLSTWALFPVGQGLVLEGRVLVLASMEVSASTDLLLLLHFSALVLLLSTKEVAEAVLLVGVSTVRALLPILPMVAASIPHPTSALGVLLERPWASTLVASAVRYTLLLLALL